MLSDSTYLSCYCQDSKEYIKDVFIFCSKCNRKMHLKCHYGIHKQNDDDNSQCFCCVCFIEKLNPYEAIDRIFIQPMALKSIMKNGGKPFQTTFSLPQEILKKIKIDYKIYIFCIKSDGSFTDLKDLNWPKRGFRLLVNFVKMNLVNKVPLNISSNVKYENQIKFDCEDLNQQYTIFCVGVKKRNINEIVPEPNPSTENDYRTIQKKLFKQFGINEEKISFTDIYSSNLIKKPVRGRKCQHFRCFDFTNYVRINQAKNILKCPICQQNCLLYELVEDLFVKKIIEEYKEKLIKGIEDFDVFINDEGIYYEKKKIETKNDSDDNNNNETSKKIEQLDNSPKRDKVKRFQQINREDYQLEILKNLKMNCQNLISQSPLNYQENVLNYLSDFNYFKDLNPHYFTEFISSLNIHPIKSNIIFPQQITLYSSNSVEKICEDLKKKYERLFKLIELWSNSEVNIVELIIELMKNEKGGKDHYFALEILLGAAYLLYQPNLLIYLEILIGKMIGIFCTKNCFEYSDTAHVIDLITNLFPKFYLPTRNFYEEKEKTDYYEKMVRFYFGIFSVYNNNAKKIASIFMMIFEPITKPFNSMTEKELLFIGEIEEFFVYPLLERLLLSPQEKYLFLQQWDSSGTFRNFIKEMNKNHLYGFEVFN